MIIKHFTDSLNIKKGGTTTVISQLANAQSKHIKVGIIAIEQASTHELLGLGAGIEIRDFGLDGDLRKDLYRAYLFKKYLKQLDWCEKGLLHVHGIWSPWIHFLVRKASENQYKYILQPHGMLMRYALKQKSLRKRLAMSCYQRRDIKRADVLIVNSWAEYYDIRRLGFTNDIALIPHGINQRQEMRRRTFAHSGHTTNTLTILYVGRIAELKGLRFLVEALGRVHSKTWCLKLAGPDYGELKTLQYRAEELGIGNRIDYLGEINDLTKWDLYRSADVLVLPSKGESFGMVVAEALSVGVPVLTTRNTPWEDLNKFKCGWWIDLDVNLLTRTLDEIAKMSAVELMRMGDNGYHYSKRFSWSVAAEHYVDVYRWVMDGGLRPECVISVKS